MAALLRETPASIDQMVKQARTAQRIYERFSQEQVDLIVKTIAKTVYDNAEMLARMAVEETGMGVYEDKVQKNKGKSQIIWHSLRGKKSVGIIERNEKTRVIAVAKPMGIVGSVTPVTNPIATPMSNAMFALKGRNAIIVAPHPRAKACSAKTIDLINQAIMPLGAPANLVQVIREPSTALTGELMRLADVVVATGGAGMVKSAYSSGKPAYGVGPGNVQVILDRGIDYAETAQKIIKGRAFDNGIICSCEQAVIIHEDDYSQALQAFTDNGAYYVDKPEQADALRRVLFKDRVINKLVVGQPVGKIASLAGIELPEGTKVLLVPSNGAADDVLRLEKMCPVLAAFTYRQFDEAIAIASQNLRLEGQGHSCAVHSLDQNHIEAVALALNTSRVVVNQASSLAAGGSYFNGFSPTATLGCGSWGNNSISENLGFKHLINIQRIGMPIADAKVPDYQELWA